MRKDRSMLATLVYDLCPEGTGRVVKTVLGENLTWADVAKIRDMDLSRNPDWRICSVTLTPSTGHDLRDLPSMEPPSGDSTRTLPLNCGSSLGCDDSIVLLGRD